MPQILDTTDSELDKDTCRMSGALFISRRSFIKTIDLITDALDKYRGIRAHHVTYLTAPYLAFARRQETYFLACMTSNNQLH